MPQLLHTQVELDRWRDEHITLSGRSTIAFVPTMGALHEGHLALVRRARELADTVIVSIFVNPRQFGAGEDFDKYPRTLDADVRALDGLADVVFAPSVDDVYPPGDGTDDVPTSVVHVRFAGPVGDSFEGASRPGHFDGMLTVVGRLFEMVKPDVAVFGQKDAQQVFLVRRLIAEHFPGIALEVVPTVRESDGIAMSSRNRYLSPTEHAHALVLSRAMNLASSRPQEALASMRSMIVNEPEVTLDYVAAVDARTFEPVPENGDAIAPGTPITYIVAARVGATRLLDTVNVELSS